MSYDLSGKTVCITGATSGIGYAAVLQFSKSGAFVIGVGRSKSRIENTIQAIKDENPSGQIHFLHADLSIQDDIRSLNTDIPLVLKEGGFSHLDVLINNAGVYLGKKHITPDGIEMTFAVNHLSGFILANGLRELLSRSENGKVLSITSYSHRTTPLNLNRITNPWPYLSVLAYKRSKLCNVLFTYEFNRRNDKVTAFVVDPGLVNTAITSKGSRGISHHIWKNLRKKGTSPDKPVQTLLFLAGEEKVDTSKGFYFEDCQPKQPSRKSENISLAGKLWALSSELTQIVYTPFLKC